VPQALPYEPITSAGFSQLVLALRAIGNWVNSTPAPTAALCFYEKTGALEADTMGQRISH
jgi:hypothetical protein